MLRVRTALSTAIRRAHWRDRGYRGLAALGAPRARSSAAAQFRAAAGRHWAHFERGRMGADHRVHAVGGVAAPRLGRHASRGEYLGPSIRAARSAAPRHAHARGLQHGGAVLEEVRRLGVRLSVDDFGTGYSSLGYLRRFPIDTLMIDRSFIRDIPGDAEDAAIAHAIIMMGQSLKLELIAEGVETAVQQAFLQSCGCHLMQGYLFSKPLPVEEMDALLASKTRDAI